MQNRRLATRFVSRFETATRFIEKRIRSSAAFCFVAAGVLYSSLAAADTLTAGDPDNTFNLDDTFVTNLGAVTSLRFLPDGRMLIAEKAGDLSIRQTDGTITLVHSFTVDSSSEKGLLGLAVDPNFSQTNRIFVYYSGGPSDANKHRVSSFVLNGDTLDQNSESVLVENIEGPANHDGGGLTIHGDYLYIGTGDTGCNQSIPTPPALHGNLLATSFNSANGKLLRVHLDGTIPADNPYANASNVSGINLPFSDVHCPGANSGQILTTSDNARPELYAVGFRNAFRIWADPMTGFVWVGDVGEVQWEEIDVVTAPGGHYGWPFIEGPLDPGWGNSKCSELSPNPGDCKPPVYACHHGGPSTLNGVMYDGDCQSITGGIIVDDCQFPIPYRGRYFFADNVTAHVWTLDVNAERNGFIDGTRQEFAMGDGYITDIVSGPDGAIYLSVFGNSGGHITRVSPKVPAVDPTCGMGGTGGVGGSGGSGGAAGSAGSGAGGGAGGAAGSPGGSGGSAGSGASGGSAGAAGSGGSGGATGGSAGSSGESGSSGSAGSAASGAGANGGSSGSSAGGVGGTNGSGNGATAGSTAGTTAATPTSSDDGGCSVGSGTTSSGSLMSVGWLLALTGLVRRRPTRQQSRS